MDADLDVDYDGMIAAAAAIRNAASLHTGRAAPPDETEVGHQRLSDGLTRFDRIRQPKVDAASTASGRVADSLDGAVQSYGDADSTLARRAHAQ
jgi:hypothetical protein